MALELEGKVYKIMPEVTGEGRNGKWVKQEFIIETREQYPKKACFSLWGDKTGDLKRFKMGEDIKVSFNIDSREYNDRWYTDLRAWKLEKLGANTQNNQQETAPPITEEDTSAFGQTPADDLPF